MAKTTTTKARTKPGVSADKRRVDALEARQNETDGKIDALAGEVAGVGSKIDQLLAAMQAPGVIDRSRVDARELDGAHREGVVTADTDEDGDTVLVRPGMTDIENPNAQKLLEYERFLQEPIEIEILSTGAQNEDPVVEIGVNGRTEILARGQRKTVARKFVEQLFRMRSTTFRNEEYVRNDGARDVRWPSSTGLRYPFVVHHDPNPRGPAWARKIVASP